MSTFSPLFYADAKLKASAGLSLSEDYENRAIYVVDGVDDNKEFIPLPTY